LISVFAQRPQGRSGATHPSSVGTIRDGFGVPYDVRTFTGQPLSSDFAQAIKRGLDACGIDAKVMETIPYATESSVLANMLARSADRQVVLTISEWNSDTLFATELYFNLKLSIYDISGSLVASIVSNGSRDLGRSAIPPAHAKAVLPVAAKEILESMLGDPEIISALK